MLPFGATGQAVLDKLDPLYYPPALTGLRGSHVGSSTHAHARAWTKKSDWGPTTQLNESYDLFVVGGGISGLSAAYFYQQKHGKDKKVLILDNHDDFGGHAEGIARGDPAGDSPSLQGPSLAAHHGLVHDDGGVVALGP